MKNDQIRLVIADDHALFRGGLKSLLRHQRDMRVVAEAGNVSEITTALAQNSCDVLLLDLQMERNLLSEVAELAAVTKVLILTASESTENAIAAMRFGARAVVQKRFAVHVLVEAIRVVSKGLVWMPPTLQAEIAAQWSEPAAKHLTTREAAIVCSVALGLRNAEIGARLSISESTVKAHLNNIFQKLALRDRVEVAIYAFRHGLVSPQEQNGPRNERGAKGL
jgi:DNA-binding NarL/FixJ family response regulator